MAFFPGSAGQPAATPSEKALKFAFFAKCLVGALAINSLLRILSFSIWATITDLFVCFYAVYVLSYLNSKDEIIFLESFMCLTFIAGMNVFMSLFALVDLITGKQALYDKLQPWQVIVGYCTNGASIVIYLCLAGLMLLLTKELEKNLVHMDEEATPLMNQGSKQTRVVRFYDQNRSQLTQTVFPTGTYAPYQGEGTEKSDKQKFPGKGYSLK